MNEILIFGLGIGAIIYISFKLGKEKGTMLASERAVDIMIAMGYLKETRDGEIEKVEKAELKTSFSLIEDVTSLEQIAEALRPTKGLNH